MVRIVHGDIPPRGIAFRTRLLEITAVSTLQDVELWVVDLGIHMIVHGTILGPQMLRTEEEVSRDERNVLCRYSQSGRAFGTKLAVEDEDSLLITITTDRRLGFEQAWSQQHLFDRSRGVDVNSTCYMATLVFVFEPTVDDVEIVDLRLKFSIKESVNL